MIGREIGYFISACRFVTRILAPGQLLQSNGEIARASRYFPLVGIAAGLIASPILLSATLVFPQPVPLVVAVAAMTMLTLAGPERGLARAADFIAAPQGPGEAAVESRGGPVGAAGAMALMLALAAKLTALAAVDLAAVMRSFIAAQAVSWFVFVLALRFASGRVATTPLAAEEEQARPGLLEIVLAAVLGVGPAILFFTTHTAVTVFTMSALVTILAGAFLFRRRVPLSDVPWALAHIFETMFYLGAAGAIAGPG